VAAFHGIGGDEEPVTYGFQSLHDTTEGFPFLGYVVDIGGQRLYHAGDTLVYPGLASILGPLQLDVVFLPINGRDFYREAEGTVGNMNEDEAAQLAEEVRARIAVPIHFDAFVNNLGDVGRFASRLALSRTTAVLLLPRGRPVALALPGEEG
jgi:L-ascorbate metabolism protein UlaG (beta-lactamase superfamily)